MPVVYVLLKTVVSTNDGKISQYISKVSLCCPTAGRRTSCTEMRKALPRRLNWSSKCDWFKWYVPHWQQTYYTFGTIRVLILLYSSQTLIKRELPYIIYTMSVSRKIFQQHYKINVRTNKAGITYELANDKWQVRSQFKVKDKQPESEQTKADFWQIARVSNSIGS